MARSLSLIYRLMRFSMPWVSINWVYSLPRTLVIVLITVFIVSSSSSINRWMWGNRGFSRPTVVVPVCCVLKICICIRQLGWVQYISLKFNLLFLIFKMRNVINPEWKGIWWLNWFYDSTQFKNLHVLQLKNNYFFLSNDDLEPHFGTPSWYS